MFALCLSCFSCAKKPEKPIVQSPGMVTYEKFAISVSPNHWTPIVDDSFTQMKKLQNDANAKLPLSFMINTSYQGKNSELMHIGHLETKEGKVPSIQNINDYFLFLYEKVKDTNQAVMDTGKQDKLQYWVIRIKMPEFYSIKLVYYFDKSTKPLFIDFYVSTQAFTELVSIEFDKLISSISVINQ